ncbi:MAG: HAMP domain-containing histidine kinase [Pseudobutyrivibrio sp.]|nr:HAMP domain-containing histidine kinase [Pseudobutyrivibrio sp.]
MSELYLIIAVICGLIALFAILKWKNLEKNIKQITKQVETMVQEDDLRFISSYSDVKSISNLNKSLNSMIALYEKREVFNKKQNKEIMRILTNISHDLRTPLTVIMGYAEMLYEKVIKREAIEEIERVAEKLFLKAKSLGRIVYQMLDMSKINSGDYRINLADTYISGFCNKIILDYYDVFEQEGFDVEIKALTPDVQLKIDINAAERILKNLIENVLKHAKDGKFIGIKIKEKQEALEVHVIDKGKGISKENIEKIFERGYFFRNENEARNNSGIGLSIAWNLAKMMDGNLYISSSLPTGTDFCWEIKK